MPNLWGIIQFTSGPYNADTLFLDPELCRVGWYVWLKPYVELVRRFKPYGVIFHTWRGLRPDASQAFFNRANIQRKRQTCALASNFASLYQVVRAIQRMGVLCVSYDGPFADELLNHDTGSIGEMIRAELCATDQALAFDGHIIDGSGDKPADSAAVAGLRMLDALTRLGGGIESMATATAPHLVDRYSLTLAGDAADDGVTMRSGAYDPEKTVTPERLHGKFMPRAAITGETIVMDVADFSVPGTPGGFDSARWHRRGSLIVSQGCSLCVPLTMMQTSSQFIQTVTVPAVANTAAAA